MLFSHIMFQCFCKSYSISMIWLHVSCCISHSQFHFFSVNTDVGQVFRVDLLTLLNLHNVNHFPPVNNFLFWQLPVHLPSWIWVPPSLKGQKEAMPTGFCSSAPIIVSQEEGNNISSSSSAYPNHSVSQSLTWGEISPVKIYVWRYCWFGCGSNSNVTCCLCLDLVSSYTGISWLLTKCGWCLWLRLTHSFGPFLNPS